MDPRIPAGSERPLACDSETPARSPLSCGGCGSASLLSGGSARPWAGAGAPCLPPSLRRAREQYPEVGAPHRRLHFLHQSGHICLVLDVCLGGLSFSYWSEPRGRWPAFRKRVGTRLEAINHVCACQRAGQYPSDLPALLSCSPPQLALPGCPRATPSRNSLVWGLCGASQRQPKGPGGRTCLFWGIAGGWSPGVPWNSGEAGGLATSAASPRLWAVAVGTQPLQVEPGEAGVSLSLAAAGAPGLTET